MEAWRRFDSYLDVAGFNFAPYAGLTAALRAERIRIRTYAGLADDPQRLEKLYELDWALWQDVPYGQTVARRSLPQFVAEEVNHPNYLPNACFIAVQDGRFIGYSNLTKIKEGYNTAMTGVLPAYRGKGVATLLKLCGIQYAQANGNGRLWVANDSVNVAMLALNDRLGFVRAGAIIHFARRF